GHSVALAEGRAPVAEVKRLASENGEVKGAAFLPDGRIVTGDEEGVMQLFDPTHPETARTSRKLAGHTKRVPRLSLSRDVRRMLSSSEDGSLKLWDTKRNEVLGSLRVSGEHASGVLSPDGRHAVTTFDDLSLVAMPSGKLEKRLRQGVATGLSPFSPDGTQVLTGEVLWELPSGREVWLAESAGGPAVFSPDGRRIYQVGGRHGLEVLDATSGVVTARLGQSLPAGRGQSMALALSPREDFLIVEVGDAGLRIEGDHAVVGRLELPSGRLAWRQVVRSYVHDLALSPDGRLLVVTGPMHFARERADRLEDFPPLVSLRDTRTGEVVGSVNLRSAELAPACAAFTPDGRWLFVGTEQGPILKFAVSP